MGLSHIKFSSETVSFGDQSFEVRGLSLADVMQVFKGHSEALERAAQALSGTTDAQLENPAQLAGPLLSIAPEVAAALIAVAAGGSTEADMEVAKRLPLPVQVDALEKIAQLTFAAEGGAKKFLEQVARLITGATGLINGQRG